MFDILIIGAGPAGISMAVEARNAGIDSSKIIILEKMPEHSFSIKKYYPDNKLVTANYKGVESKCTGVMCISDLSKNETISYLDKTIAENRLAVNYEENVWKIHKNEDESFIVYTDKGEYASKIVSIAIGILGKPNKPEYKLPPQLKNRILFDLGSAEIINSKVLVVGGGDSASEYCQYLVQNNNEVVLSYRKTDFARMNDINRISLLALEKENRITILRGSDIASVEGNAEKPHVTFAGAEIQAQSFDYIVYALGGTTPKNFLQMLKIEFDGEAPILGHDNETSVKGLFLLGDLAAGTRGGSIIWAFNSSRNAIKKICNDYLECSVF